jgi:ParB-like chromosome segregation protein Spo0J
MRALGRRVGDRHLDRDRKALRLPIVIERAAELAMRRFGFTNPVLIDDGNQIIAGHGRVEAAKLVGLAVVPY